MATTCLFGNRCGHRPDDPVLLHNIEMKKGKGGMPAFFHKAVERIKRYYWYPDLLPSLNFANGSKRKQRSERREACVRTLNACMYLLNLTTMCVGIATEEGFKHFKVATIQKYTGLSEKRVYRALLDLKLAGLITIKQPRCKKPDGQWMGQVAIKSISAHLFTLLGMDVSFQMARQYAAKRHKEKGLKAPGKADHARYQLFLRGLRNKMSRRSQSKKSTAQKPTSSTGPPSFEVSLQRIKTTLDQRGTKES